MQHDYTKTLERRRATESDFSEEAFIKACMGFIKMTVCQAPFNHLSFGNTDLWMRRNSKGEEAIFIQVNKGTPVELYGEDGYETADDIANWCDIVEDVRKCYAAGHKSYTLGWKPMETYTVSLNLVLQPAQIKAENKAAAVEAYKTQVMKSLEKAGLTGVTFKEV